MPDEPLKPSNEELLAEARENIERHRKEDLTIRVTSTDGRPVPGCRVAVRMKRHEFLFGCALFDALADREEPISRRPDAAALSHWDDFRRQAAEIFNFATLPFYWGMYEPEPGRSIADRVKRIHEWCVSCGMKTKGHPLVWHEAVPAWLPADENELLRLMRDRLAAIAADFGPESGHPLDFVDFINEPTDAPRHFDNPLARWMLKVGPGAAVRAAYDACRAFDLPRRGIINHYLRDDAYFEATGRLLKDGFGLAAIGLQSHQHSGTRPLWMFREESDRFAAFGLPVHWTENSIVSGEHLKPRRVGQKLEGPPSWPSTPEGEERQARALAEQYTVLFGHPAVAALTQWNFSDARTWLGAPSGFLDKDLRPKPSYTALHRLIREAWWTQTVIVTGADGLARTRVFRGDYELIVPAAGGKTRRIEASVRRPAVTLEVSLA